jgi:hypothetical protein
MERNPASRRKIRRRIAGRQGGTADRIDLPEAGVKGNSHMVMMDRNSDQVAALIQGWIEKHELMR